jgi:hypothetical protein
MNVVSDDWREREARYRMMSNTSIGGNRKREGGMDEMAKV